MSDLLRWLGIETAKDMLRSERRRKIDKMDETLEGFADKCERTNPVVDVKPKSGLRVKEERCVNGKLRGSSPSPAS